MYYYDGPTVNFLFIYLFYFVYSCIFATEVQSDNQLLS